MESVYVFGKVGDDSAESPKVTLAVITPTERGWRCRSTIRDRFNHDYMSKESLETVIEGWIEPEMSRMYVSSNRDEVLNHLVMQDDPSIPASSKEFHLQSFLHGDPSLSENERAERVLRHLECGW